MPTMRVTFIGHELHGNVGSMGFVNDHTQQKLDFPLRETVVLDPDKASSPEQRDLILHAMRKVKGIPGFKVEDDEPAQERKRA